jgi:hypothetical protein
MRMPILTPLPPSSYAGPHGMCILFGMYEFEILFYN